LSCLAADRKNAGRSADLRDTLIPGIALVRRATIATVIRDISRTSTCRSSIRGLIEHPDEAPAVARV
jgi:predicted nucleic acid-binding protein